MPIFIYLVRKVRIMTTFTIQRTTYNSCVNALYININDNYKICKPYTYTYHTYYTSHHTTINSIMHSTHIRHTCYILAASFSNTLISFFSCILGGNIVIALFLATAVSYLSIVCASTRSQQPLPVYRCMCICICVYK